MKIRYLAIYFLLFTTTLCEGKAIKPQESQNFVMGELKGQLGNQCFIIAATVSLALDHKATPVFPDLLIKKSFDIPINYKKVFFRLIALPVGGLQIIHTYTEPSFNYHPIPFVPNMKLSGYFQSEKYFKHHKKEILALFAPSDEITHYLQNKYNQILSHPCTVAIHLRAYSEEVSIPLYYNCTRAYYEHAMGYFPEDALFVVFSDKMDLCRKTLKDIPRNLVFIEGEEDYHDFYLMSMCKHNIICNSTYSWWAAYLNRNLNKIVVCPPLWFNPGFGLNSKDLIPEEWYIVDY